MRALQYTAIGMPPEVREVPTPRPTGSEVLIKISAAGVCHSDEYIMGLPAEQFRHELPLTIGHEGAGVVSAFGGPADGVAVGDPVAVYGAWGCGSCRACATGAENYCAQQTPWPGFDAPGFMAEYALVPSPRHLVPLGDLDPVQTVPLTDAGLTPYHAIKPSMAKLVPGSTAVVIGAGGLGHLAIQILRALTPARVLAFDLSEDKLEFARQVGAHDAFASDTASVDAVRDLTEGRGAEAIFDFVGIQETADLAVKLAATGSDIVLVGLGAGFVRASVNMLPGGTTVRVPVWGTRSELIEVIELARSGAIKVETERFTLDDGAVAFERLHTRSLRGRAVLVP